MFSGILYLTEGNPTVFLDPRPAADVLSLNYKEETKCFYGSRSLSPAIPNTLVLFPSWLCHLVFPNPHEEERKSISFNIILRGKYGTDRSLQQVLL